MGQLSSRVAEVMVGEEGRQNNVHIIFIAHEIRSYMVRRGGEVEE